MLAAWESRKGDVCGEDHLLQRIYFDKTTKHQKKVCVNVCLLGFAWYNGRCVKKSKNRFSQMPEK